MDREPGKVQQLGAEGQELGLLCRQEKQKQEISLAPNSNGSDADGKKYEGTQEEEQVFANICKYLTEKQIDFKIMEHEATRTSEQSAAIRKTPLEWGSKTMLVNAVDNKLMLLIYRANRKVSWKKIRKVPQIGKKAQMATEQQVLKLGVKPGGVPPFPHMIGLTGVLDAKFKQVQTMAFNAGHKCKSIIMKTADFPLQDIIIADVTQD